MNQNDTDMINKPGAASGLSAAAGSELLGTCEQCGTKRPFEDGERSTGRTGFWMMLYCKKCKYDQPHKFPIQNSED